MRNLTSGFTMRRDGVLPRGDWFTFKAKDTDTPKVYIYDEIGFWGTEASDFVNQLNEITASSLELHLNSPGGEIFDGLAIYNALKQHKAKVTVYVDGLAASAASFIAQAGDEVIMARNAQMMIHDGIAFAYGNEADMLETAALLSQLSDNIADIYAFRAGKRGFDNTLEDFRALMRQEVWYNGKEAVEAGLADTVLDHDEEEADADAKNKWDLSFYNYAGREKAESPLRMQEKIRLAASAATKEKNMGDENPTDTTDPAVTPAPAPEGTPPPEPDSQPTGDPTEEGTEAQPTDQPDEPVTTTPGGSGPQANANQQGVMIDGKLVTDWAVINRHFNTLSTAHAETQASNRSAFVEGLAAANKIPATMIDHLTKLVNGSVEDGLPAMSDQQYAAFQASYESAPASDLFAQHATTTEAGRQAGQPGSQQMTADAKADRISVLEGIVAMHQRNGMPKDRLEQTASYVELQQLTNNDKS